MAFRIYQILQGTPVEAESSIVLLPAGESGERGSLRRLVHPDGANFPPIVYYSNPIRTFNFGTDVLRHPITNVQRTLSSSKTVRFEEVLEDVIVSEVWEPIGGLSMPFFMFAFLYEYLNNPPALDPITPDYIIWEPRDETETRFNVEILGLQLGSGTPGKYSVRRWRASGGPFGIGVVDPAGYIDTPTDTMDVRPTSILDQAVTLTMRIISEVD